MKCANRTRSSSTAWCSKTSMPLAARCGPSAKDRKWSRSKPKAAGRRYGASPDSLIICVGNGKRAGAVVMPLVSLLCHDVYRRSPSESGFCSPGADRYKLTVAQLASQLDGVAAVRHDRRILATAMVEASPARTFPFLLTVDDGGVSYHQVIADLLEARGWRGHAFVSTDFIGRPGFLPLEQRRGL